MKLTTKVISNRGGRKSNEDSLKCMAINEYYCWVVADGLGGHLGGEIASKLAVDEVIKIFSEKPEVSDDLIRSCIENAQSALINYQNQNIRYSSMKTTIALLIADGRNSIWGHVGDTRLYYLKRGKIIKQTKDHSIPQALANAGEILPEQIRFHEDRNKLLRVLGNEENVRYTLGKPDDLLEEEDAFLICTDGFWEYVTEKDVESTYKEAESLEHWLKLMEIKILEASKDEENDNYTAIVIFAK